MAAARFLKAAYLAWFSKPVADRAVYRTVRRQRPRRILLIGLRDAIRARRLVELAQRYAIDEPVELTGIDMFEGRPSNIAPGHSLKDAHRILNETGARIQLVPGDPISALARTANSLPDIDLMLLDADHDVDSMSSAWFYVPRMLHSSTRTLVESDAGVDEKTGQRLTQWEPLDRKSIDERAGNDHRRRAA